MSKNLKVLIVSLLFIGIITKDKFCEHLGFGQNKVHGAQLNLSGTDSSHTINTETTYDTLFRWNDQLMDWIMVEEAEKKLNDLFSQELDLSQEPIELDWDVLMNIDYVLKYYEEFEMEIYSPVFTEALEAIHKKEVVVEGYVIPFDEAGEFLSLSLNPFAACFFCGKASPASVISLYLKDESKKYKVDDFKKFKGVLHLNHDDPDEFYYILRQAEEI